MDDSEVILYLCPCNNEAVNVVGHARNQHMLVESYDLPDKCLGNKCLAIRFDQTHGDQGVVAGNSQSADIVLSDYRTISRRHFYISFDEWGRLFLMDTSTDGTRITYDHKKGDKKKHFKWLLNTPDAAAAREPLELEVTNRIKFKIVLAAHDTATQEYANKVWQFHQNARPETPCLLREQATMRVSNEVTPPIEGECYVVTSLGSGGYGTVNRVWNVSTGNVYAIKYPLPLRQSKDEKNRWRKEAEIMMDNNHDHIIECYGEAGPKDPGHDGFKFDKSRHLGILFEYAPFGSLHDYYAEGGYCEVYGKLSTSDVISMLCQLLSALQFLHGKLVCHRDIKPANVLIMQPPGSPSGIYVKFADFGLARIGYQVTTICGSQRYAAPEISEYLATNKQGPKYVAAKADIYSLGIVIAELECEMPQWNGVSWHTDVRNAVLNGARLSGEGSATSKVLYFVREYMLPIDPNSRQSAAACFALASNLASIFGVGTIASTPPY